MVFSISLPNSAPYACGEFAGGVQESDDLLGLLPALFPSASFFASTVEAFYDLIKKPVNHATIWEHLSFS
jgi:hypothetical protein